MGVPRERVADQSMAAFRRRINAFFGHPQAAEFAASLHPPSPRPPTTAASALDATLSAALSRLGVATTVVFFRLRNSLTIHDGQVVAMTGDASPVGPEERVRVVTTTTTVLDGTRLRSETTVLVFEPLQPTVGGSGGIATGSQAG